MKNKIIVISTFIAVGLIYYFINPTVSVLVPKCPLKLLTGYDCPSCGAQRFIHAILNGRVVEAFSYNLFLIIALPYFIFLFVEWLLPRGNKVKAWIKRYVGNRYVAYVYILLYFVWFAVRNIYGL